jgi:hypothetical protein
VQALRTVQLEVSWLEGGEKRGVSRTTFLIDFERLSQLMSSSPQQQPAAPTETATPEEPTTIEDLEAQLPSEVEQQ